MDGPIGRVSYTTCGFRSAVKEVTGLTVAPATLAGRGVIELIGADAGKLLRRPSFLPGSPGGISPRGTARHLHSGGLSRALGQCSFPILPIVLWQRPSEICEIISRVTPLRSRGWSDVEPTHRGTCRAECRIGPKFESLCPRQGWGQTALRNHL